MPSSSSSSSICLVSGYSVPFESLRDSIVLRVPTVMGLILTPSSTWAALGSSDSLCPRTVFPQRVLTKVVRPVHIVEKSLDSAFRWTSGSELERNNSRVRCWDKLTSARCSTDHQAELDTLLHVLLAANHLLLVSIVSVPEKGCRMDRDANAMGWGCNVLQGREGSPDWLVMYKRRRQQTYGRGRHIGCSSGHKLLNFKRERSQDDVLIPRV